MTSTNKTTLPLPAFETTEVEAEYWQNHDSSDFIDWQQARAVMLSRFKPTLRTISLRLPESMLPISRCWQTSVMCRTRAC